MDFNELIKIESNKEYFINLMSFVNEEYQNKKIYPAKENIFKMFEETSYDALKVVILGQDPYHGENQAMGLAFSVPKSQSKLPPSLKNIFKELNSDLGVEISKHGDLTKWAKQGVLLMNTVLSVEEKKPNSHANKGYERLTDEIIKYINLKNDTVIYILWGNNARVKKALITNEKHFVIEGVHPSPLSAHRGFFGSKPFSEVNRLLELNNKVKIDWSLNDD